MKRITRFLETSWFWIGFLTVIHCIFFRDVFYHWGDYLIYGDINPYDINSQKWIDDARYMIYPYNGTGTVQPAYLVVMILGYIYA
jgi:hypothetical protein